MIVILFLIAIVIGRSSYSDDNQKENDWIDMMLYFLVEKFELCFEKLQEGIEAVGCNYYNEKMNEQQEIRREFPIFGDSITNTTLGRSLIETMVGKQMMDTFDNKQNKSAVRKYRKLKESLRLINEKCKKSSECKSKCCVNSVCRPYTVCVSSERVKKNREKAMENIRRSNIIEHQKIPTDPFGSYIQKVYNKNVFPD